MVSYEFYMCNYHGGSISFEDWDSYAFRAAAQLARYKRIYSVSALEPDAEDLAVCAMADAMYSFDLIANGEGGAVQSSSIGSVSTSYASSGGSAIDISPKGQEMELYRCASLYLDIYRGVG